MPKNEDGEFELILGNRQLLSMFFVVVVLLGVFFVMGYIVGRNSAPVGGTEVARKTDAKPLVVDSPAPQQTPTESSAPTTPASSTPASTAPQLPPEKSPVETVRPEPSKTEPAKPVPTKSEPAAKREAKVAEKADESKASKAKAITQSNAPAAGGTYLQLSATTKHDADAMVDVLRGKSFPALDAEVPEKPGLFRVLVGPIPSGDMNKVRDDLNSKGFPGTAAIKKTY